MKIDSAEFTNDDHSIVKINGKMCVPCAPGNRLFDEVVKPFIDGGGLVQSYAPPIDDGKQTLRDEALDALLEHASTLPAYPTKIKEYVDAAGLEAAVGVIKR